MDLGRNELCFCGSGKKYKKCCLQKQQETTVSDLNWQRVKGASTQLVRKLVRFTAQVYGDQGVAEAWGDFYFWPEDPKDLPDFESSHDMHSCFFPWFFYSWIPEEGYTRLMDSSLLRKTPSDVFYEREKNNLTPEEEEYLFACQEQYLSFYEILGTAPDQVSMRNLLTEETFLVHDRAASKNSAVGTILFCKVIQVLGIYQIEGAAPYVLNGADKLDILKFRKSIQRKFKKITTEIIGHYEFEILDLYHSIMSIRLRPMTDRLANTDGEAFIPHKMIYKIESSRNVFEKIHSLSLNNTKEELLKQAHVLENGEILNLKFSWLQKGNRRNKSWENTILGNLTLTERELTVEVNSKERSAKFKKLFKQLCPEGWTLKSTVIESVESMMSKVPEQTAEERQAEEVFQNSPEYKEAMEKMMKDHWAHWYDQKIPALNNMTPKKATQSKLGRELLESLLKDYERNAIERPMIGQTIETIKEVRKNLGMLL